jgi:hypothetical protein
MVQEGRADEEMAGLVERTALAASAIVQGDMRTYLSLIHHAEDYTLMAPFGGPVTHGFDGSEESVAAMERFSRRVRRRSSWCSRMRRETWSCW